VGQELCSALTTLAAAYEERDAGLAARTAASRALGLVTLYEGDAAAVLRQCSLPTADLVITSPPYFGVTDYVKSQRLSMEWFGHDIEPRRLAEIGARSKRHRRAAASDYIQDLHTVFEGAAASLRSGGAFVVIVGESDKRESVLDGIISSLTSIGLMPQIQRRRRISQQRRQHPSLTHEVVLVMLKPGRSMQG